MPKKMRCSHILLSWDQAIDSTHSRELAFALHDAKQILFDLQKGIIAWNIAVKEHTACRHTWNNGGDLGWFDEHDMLAEVWIACLTTAIGELAAEPINSPHGIHIIFRTG